MKRFVAVFVALGAIGVVVAVWIVVGDGSGGERHGSMGARKEASRSRRLQFAPARKPVDTPPIADGVGQVGCGRAIARKGRVVGSIVFRVRCSSHSSQKPVAFIVERYSLDRPAKLQGIARYSRFLSSSNSSDAVPSGYCRLRQQILGCRGTVSGSGVLRGRITVSERSRCAQGVAVVAVKGLPCTQGACQGPLLARELFSGRPAGC